MLSYPRAQWIFLTFGDPPVAAGGVSEGRRVWPDPPVGVPGWPFIPAAGQEVRRDGKTTDGRMGGRFEDEGPETVVLHDSCRGTEAARWRVNLTTGQRVQQT